MSAFEGKLNAMINKDKNLINKFPKNLTVIVIIVLIFTDKRRCIIVSFVIN